MSNQSLKECVTAFGRYNLQRIPDNDKNLQAWNSADLYLLQHLSEIVEELSIDLYQSNILIMNDAFGVLSIALAKYSCDSYSDSYISHYAIEKNCANNCAQFEMNINAIKSTDDFTQVYDIVLFKEVKNQAFLTDQMNQLSKHIHSKSLIIGAIMAKNLQKNTLQIFSQTLGSCQASLTWKKARLLTVHVDEKMIEHRKKDHSLTISKVLLEQAENEENPETLYSYANVFSRNKLDIGTRFLLQNLPQHKSYQRIIDLGCGNGVLALKMAQYNPQAHITCLDESYMALASAKLTLDKNLPKEHPEILYQADHAMTHIESNSADLIVCNPPFHQEYVVGDAIAWLMFQQAHKVLQKGGELWIVGNRHLSYHLKLQKIFSNHQVIDANKKFVIIKATKR